MDIPDVIDAWNELQHMCSFGELQSNMQMEPFVGTGGLEKDEMDEYQNSFSSVSKRADMSTGNLGNVTDEAYEYMFSQLEAGDLFHDEAVEVANWDDSFVSDSGAAMKCSRPGSPDGVHTENPIKESFSAEQKPSGLSAAFSLLAQLRATKVDESVVRDAVQRFGGGQEGLRAVGKVIMYWVLEKNRDLSQCIDIPALATSENEGPCQSLRSNGAQGIVADDQFSSFLSCDSFVPEMNDFVTTSMCGLAGDSSLWALRKKMGSGSESSFYGDGSICENESRLQSEISFEEQEGAVCWIPSSTTSASLREFAVRKSWMSPVSSVPSLASDSDSPSHRSGKNVQKHSTSGTSPSQCLGEVLVSPSLTAAKHLEDFSYENHPFPLTSAEWKNSSIVVEGRASSLASAKGLSRKHPLSSDISSCTSSDMRSSLYTENVPMTSSVCAKQKGRDVKLWSFGGPVSGKSEVNGMHATSREVADDGETAEQLVDANFIAKTSAKQARKYRMYKKARLQFLPVRETDIGTVSQSICQFPLRDSPSLPHGLLNLGGRAENFKDQDPVDLEYLFEKVLRPSDVGSLGRIVLHKKYAESCLPWLEAKAGCKLAFEDYTTGEKMVLRYRFWPNNKGRMYLLENTGDFVKRHDLQEFDRMVIYKRQQREHLYVIRARKAGNFARDALRCAHGEENADEARRVT